MSAPLGKIFGWILNDLRAGPERARLVRDAYTLKPVQPEEVWIPTSQAWVRLNGEWVTGWYEGEHFGFRPNIIGRWRIRRAARIWRAKR